MKKNLLFVLFFLCVGLSAQNLSLNELIEMRKESLEEVETNLTRKGWQYNTGKEPTENSLGISRFVYLPKGSYNFAESFLNFYYNTFKESRIHIQVSNQSKYLEYLEAAKKIAIIPVYSKIDNGNLVKIYVGSTTTFEFTTSNTRSSSGEIVSIWKLLIAENEDYYDNFDYY